MAIASRLTYPEHIALRDAVTKACGHAAYLHYTDSLWQRISGAFDWTGCWPVVDGKGYLTGEVLEQSDDLLTTADYEAVIRPVDAQAGGWDVDYEEGMATPTTGVRR